MAQASTLSLAQHRALGMDGDCSKNQNPLIPESSPFLPLWQWGKPGITAVALQGWSHNLKAELGYF